MFSSFRNSNLGYFIYTILVASLGIGSLVFFWFMVTGFNVGVYSENTLVGSVYIGGLTEEEAIEKVNQRVNQWLASDRVLFQAGYQGYYYTFDRDLLVFDIQRSFSDIREGSINPLIVTYRGDNRNLVKTEILNAPFMHDFDASTFDLDRAIDAILVAASEMKTFSRQELHQFFVNPAAHQKTLNEITYIIPATVPNQTAFYERLLSVYPEGVITIEPFELFSVLEAFEGTLMTPAELGTFGGALLSLITPTPFNIYERSFNSAIDLQRYTMDNFPYYGKNVRVNPLTTPPIDFSFENNSNLTYTIEFDQPANNRITLRLIGFEFLNRIVIETNVVPIAYDTETTTIIDEVQPGQDGRIVTVNRKIFNIFGDLIFDSDIIFEFYPADKAVIYVGE